MELKTYFAQDRNGSLIPAATVAIYLTGTETLASGLTTVSNAPLSNPFTADADGKIQFHAPDGIYDMQVSQGSTTGVRVTFQCVDVEQQLSDANSAADRAEDAADRAESVAPYFDINTREHWRRVLADSGLNLVEGSFEEGATVTNSIDAVWHQAAGKCYTWGGTIPKTIPENSTPASTGGIAGNAWRDTISNLTQAVRVALSQGGTVQDAIVTLHVDAFGADPTGMTDSTSAVNAAVAAASILLTSAMENEPNPQCVAILYGKGRYKQQNIALKSGVLFKGQGAFSTCIIPATDNVWCFRTFGTEPYDTGREAKRAFRCCIQDMHIGGGYQKQFTDIAIPVNGSGVYIAHASYVSLSNVYFRHLDGSGLLLESVWDSNFDNLRFMSVGNTRVAGNSKWALAITPGDDLVDGCNANRFYGTHIEGCPAMLYVGKRSRHNFFFGGKFESIRYNNATDFESCIIRGANGLVFSGLEMSWSNIIKPMFDIVGSTSDVEGADSDHSVGVVFLNPSIIDSSALSGDYFKYSSSRGPLQILGGYARNARYMLANCSNVIWKDMSLSQCGPALSTTTGETRISGIDIVNHRADVVDFNVFTFTGTGNVLKDSKLHVFGGSTSYGKWALTNTSSELEIKDIRFGGNMQYGVSGLSSAQMRKAKNLSVMAGANVATLVNGGSPNIDLPVAAMGGSPQAYAVQATVANDASVNLGNIISGSCILNITARVSGNNHAALIHMDSAITNAFKLSDLTSKFVLGGSGVSGDGFIYVARSGSAITVTNRLGASVTVHAFATNAV